MKIVLYIGDELEIDFAPLAIGENSSLVITYGDQAVTVQANDLDSDGRTGIIYSDRFGESFDEPEETVVGDAPFPEQASCAHEFHVNPERDGQDVCIHCGQTDG